MRRRASAASVPACGNDKPPSTTSVWPVTYDSRIGAEEGDHLGDLFRVSDAPERDRLTNGRRPRDGRPRSRSSGVRMKPGATQLTRIVGPYSSAPLDVSAITAAFAAE